MRFAFLLSSALVVFACSGRERPPGLSDTDEGGGGSNGDATDGFSIDGGASACIGPPTVDSSCGAEVVAVLQQKPNLYFVLDVSGSMEEEIAPGKGTKFKAAKDSIISVARDLGHRVSYGLGVFPGPDGGLAQDGCGAGKEAFATTEGDAITCINKPPSGPVLSDFTRTVSSLRAEGGTPLTASLIELAPTIEALAGPTAVILLTDGAPNCNSTTLCDVVDCALNVTSSEVLTGTCSPGDESNNCCDPEKADESGVQDPLGFCIDAGPSAKEVGDLFEAGIPTYVIGVPGAEFFRDVMNRLATAGGTARNGEIAFYDASDTEELTDTLRTIGAQVAQACEIKLKTRPADPSMFNVYFDAVLIPKDANDGWTLDGDQVTLHGDACKQVETAEVSEIQMVTGCVTVVK